MSSWIEIDEVEAPNSTRGPNLSLRLHNILFNIARKVYPEMFQVCRVADGDYLLVTDMKQYKMYDSLVFQLFLFLWEIYMGHPYQFLTGEKLGGEAPILEGSTDMCRSPDPLFRHFFA